VEYLAAESSARSSSGVNAEYETASIPRRIAKAALFDSKKDFESKGYFVLSYP